MASNVLCLHCQERLTEPEPFIECSECTSTFHTGKCSGISVTTLKTKSEAYRLAWRCTSCRRQKIRAQPQSASDDSDQQDIRLMLKNISSKLDQLLPLKDVVEGIEDSLQFWSEQYDELRKTTNKHEQEIKELKRRTERLEENEGNVKQLAAEIDALEWKSRRLNLEINGIKETEKENLIDKLNELATQLELPQLSANDVVAVHRLPSKKDKISGIICRFARQNDRDLWWLNRKKLRDINDKVFFKENVTKQTRALLLETKNWATREKYKYVWHNNGRVLVRKADGEQAVVISSVGDLDKLG
ncbi:hypothetical protein HPB50_003752 [Hyalomma asiaticum]|uniref:Uncharacterized protein n=1 Tax=Hyalomma asiaticum TaxID=266040 RepID=A0ACB7SBX4_HYAAI|nr:hypothetical protein HPB50_003752 [Hyalomma asiaticum]